MKAKAMIDSGAEGIFLNQKYVDVNQVSSSRLAREIPVVNIDGSKNSGGRITRCATMRMQVEDHSEILRFLITDLGKDDLILGLPWLRKHNPSVDWEQGEILLDTREVQQEDTDEEYPSFQKVNATRRLRRQWQKEGKLENSSDELYLAAGFTYSQAIAEGANKVKSEKTFEELVPEHYWHYRKVFSELESERLPEHKPYDHTIDLKPNAPETHRSKNYPMSIDEQKELDKFLEENLRKGYIVESKSPIAAPVFFIKKKDGKLRLIQDYRWLNEWTIKNRYPLPLSTDLISRLANAQYFTKFDVRWGYNNIRIKEGDEWKAAFSTNRGLFEPRVMFFGLTNSPATFQALMNVIFIDLIAKGKVVVYLDDILIFTATLAEH